MSFTLAHQTKTNNSKDSNSSAKHYSPTNCFNHLNTDSWNSVFHLKRTIGNQAVQRLMRSSNSAIGFDFVKIGIIQPKLKVSEPVDAYEQETDRVAEQVVRMPNPSVLDMPTETTKDEGVINRKCAACETREEEEEKVNQNINRKSIGTAATLEASNEITNEINNIRSSGGSSLDSQTRNFMESRFGYDFSNIRIHADKRSARSADSVGALAYTVGNSIVFGEGQYQPNTLEGRRLLAHELSHVVQQTLYADSILLRRVDPDKVDERNCSLEFLTGGKSKNGLIKPLIFTVLDADYWATRMAQTAYGTLDWQLLLRDLSSYNKEDKDNKKIRELLKEHFKLDIEDPSHHGRIRIIERRYRRVVEKLESGKLAYSCGKLCKKDEHAYILPGRNHVYLCEGFFSEGFAEAAKTLIHEILHILYPSFSHSTIKRYEDFALELAVHFAK